MLHNWTRPNGCKAQLAACQDALKDQGPIFLYREKQNFSEICGGVSPECEATHPYEIYQDSVEPGAGWYDVTHPKADPFPPPYLHGYLTQESVLASLGVPLNFVGPPLHACVSSNYPNSTKANAEVDIRALPRT